MTMRLIFSLVVALLCAGAVQAGEFEDALAAHNAENYPIAFEKFKALAEQGNKNSQRIVGLYYLNGGVGMQNYKEAATWLKMAAEKGDAVAQFALAKLYYEGRGVLQDYTECLKWYRNAADQGLDDAAVALGIIYEATPWNLRTSKETGVARDNVEAMRWFRRSAELGNYYGMYRLGMGYEHGWGIKKDYIKAYMWYNLASVGSEGAFARDHLWFQMSIKAVTDSQRLARECQARKFKNCD